MHESDLSDEAEMDLSEAELSEADSEGEPELSEADSEEEPESADIDLEDFRSDKGSTGYLGVYRKAGSDRYRAVIRMDNRDCTLGSYDGLEEAALVYARKYLELHGAPPSRRTKPATNRAERPPANGAKRRRSDAQEQEGTPKKRRTASEPDEAKAAPADRQPINMNPAFMSSPPAQSSLGLNRPNNIQLMLDTEKALRSLIEVNEKALRRQLNISRREKWLIALAQKEGALQKATKALEALTEVKTQERRARPGGSASRQAPKQIMQQKQDVQSDSSGSSSSDSSDSSSSSLSEHQEASRFRGLRQMDIMAAGEVAARKAQEDQPARQIAALQQQLEQIARGGGGSGAAPARMLHVPHDPREVPAAVRAINAARPAGGAGDGSVLEQGAPRSARPGGSAPKQIMQQKQDVQSDSSGSSSSESSDSSSSDSSSSDSSDSSDSSSSDSSSSSLSEDGLRQMDIIAANPGYPYNAGGTLWPDLPDGWIS